jgi:hypothetical protein
MRNTEVEKTLFIDMDRIADEVGIIGKDKWLNYSVDDVEKCIRILENKIQRDAPDTVQLTGKFPIEVSLALGAFLGQNQIRLEYCRPGITRREVFDFRECPELGFV